jgi:hypothetical protein
MRSGLGGTGRTRGANLDRATGSSFMAGRELDRWFDVAVRPDHGFARARGHDTIDHPRHGSALTPSASQVEVARANIQAALGNKRNNHATPSPSAR